MNYFTNLVLNAALRGACETVNALPTQFVYLDVDELNTDIACINDCYIVEFNILSDKKLSQLDRKIIKDFISKELEKHQLYSKLQTAMTLGVRIWHDDYNDVIHLTYDI